AGGARARHRRAPRHAHAGLPRGRRGRGRPRGGPPAPLGAAEPAQPLAPDPAHRPGRARRARAARRPARPRVGDPAHRGAARR
ncbi:MAG: hypothetical protein AVDCRST_MAG30-1256, partial [uncultured Solirubrobacteraceae bacterium]